jgi:predicted nucleic acid-binding protein
LGEKNAAGSREGFAKARSVEPRMRILLDTSVIVDLLRERRGRRDLLSSLVQQGHRLAYCAINVTEIWAGMRSSEAGEAADFFSRLEYVEVTFEIARTAGSLILEWRRKGRTLELPDAMIAAVALHLGLTLATDNRKDFPMRELEFLPLREA